MEGVCGSRVLIGVRCFDCGQHLSHFQERADGGAHLTKRRGVTISACVPVTRDRRAVGMHLRCQTLAHSSCRCSLFANRAAQCKVDVDFLLF